MTVNVPAVVETKDGNTALGEVAVEKTFTLCGVLKEYTDLWAGGQTLVGAITTEQAMQSVRAEAVKAENLAVLQNPVFQYFLAVQNAGLEKAAIESSFSKTVTENYTVRRTEENTGEISFYGVLIFLTTILAVVCIYTVQIQRQIRQTALFRSIGITKRQLAKMLFFEMLSTAVPAAVLGILFGVCGTWLVLKVFLRYSFGKFYIRIPGERFAWTLLLWMLSSEHKKLSEKTAGDIERIPGISQMNVWGLQDSYLSFDGMERCGLVRDLAAEADRETKTDGIPVTVYVIREKDEEQYFDLAQLGIGREEFDSGEKVIVLLPFNSFGKIYYDTKTYADAGLKEGQTLNLHLYGRELQTNAFGNETTGKEEIFDVWTPKVGAVLPVVQEMNENKLQMFSARPYTVFCSVKALQNVIGDLPEGYDLGLYRTGEPFGFVQGEIFASADAKYLSTDYVLADLAASNELLLENYRAQTSVAVQESVRKIVRLVSGCGCVLIACAGFFGGSGRLYYEAFPDAGTAPAHPGGSAKERQRKRGAKERRDRVSHL